VHRHAAILTLDGRDFPPTFARQAPRCHRPTGCERPVETTSIMSPPTRSAGRRRAGRTGTTRAPAAAGAIMPCRGLPLGNLGGQRAGPWLRSRPRPEWVSERPTDAPASGQTVSRLRRDRPGARSVSATRRRRGRRRGRRPPHAGCRWRDWRRWPLPSWVALLWPVVRCRRVVLGCAAPSMLVLSDRDGHSPGRQRRASTRAPPWRPGSHVVPWVRDRGPWECRFTSRSGRGGR
jgi:hypothetical protein